VSGAAQIQDVASGGQPASEARVIFGCTTICCVPISSNSVGFDGGISIETVSVIIAGFPNQGARVTSYKIPFNKPNLVGTELRYIEDVIRGGHISGDGAYTRRCETLLGEALGVVRVVLTTSCTHALEMAALLLDIAPGDEVIVPSFTFVSTANAFALRGARPIFIDIRPDTLNLDESLLEKLITPRTKAVVPVHYAGVACEMDEIVSIARRHNVAVVEDNAHGLFSRYRGKYLGTFGGMATQSFHETKNFTCGEGGALLVNDPQLVERALVLRDKGTNRNRFLRGQVDKYTWVDLGSSYIASELQAAFLYAQLEAREHIQGTRERIWRAYWSGLQVWAQRNGVGLPVVPESCDQSYPMLYLLLPSLKRRQALIAHLRQRGILAVFHYVPLHLSDMALRWRASNNDCPVAVEVSERLLRLPFYTDLSEIEQAAVIEAVLEFKV
jgi:dTDP-4-amino-4,6-dideoxygalactose transaminase